MDAAVAAPIVRKYAALPEIVAKLEPSDVGQIFRHTSDARTFFPTWGLFVTEFALAYCYNMHFRRPSGPSGSTAPSSGPPLGQPAGQPADKSAKSGSKSAAPRSEKADKADKATKPRLVAPKGTQAVLQQTSSAEEVLPSATAAPSSADANVSATSKPKPDRQGKQSKVPTPPITPAPSSRRAKRGRADTG